MLTACDSQHPQPRPRRPHRRHRRRKGPTGQEAWSADHPGARLRGGARWLLQDHFGLLGSERGFLCQVRFQESGSGDGTLLREEMSNAG